MSLTHDVLNQSPPFVDVDLFALDTALTEAVAANGGAGARGANFPNSAVIGVPLPWPNAVALPTKIRPSFAPSTPRGNRRDEVEFHPAYHELMAHSAHAGLHNSTWANTAAPRARRPRWYAPRNSIWLPASRPGISARSP